MSFVQQKFKSMVMHSLVIVGILFLSVFFFAIYKAVAQTETASVSSLPPAAISWAFLAAAISTGMGTLGAGIAVGYVGAAALGVLGEKPELAGRALIFVGLAEGIAIYGLIIAIMILTKI